MASTDVKQFSPDPSLKPLYVIHDEEDLLWVEALGTLCAVVKRQGYLNREVYIAGNTSDWSELLQSAGSAGPFADLKLLGIHIPGGKPGKNGDEVLQSPAKRLPEDIVTAVMLPKLEEVQTQAKWFGALATKGVMLEVKAAGTAALPQWIRGCLRKLGLDIESDVLVLFTERVEGNLLTAKQEIDKLVLLHLQGYTANVADTEAAVVNVARFDVFQPVGAQIKDGGPRVAHLLEGLKESGEEPVLLLWMVTEGICTLIRLTTVLK